jgi:hypothetical protein
MQINKLFFSVLGLFLFVILVPMMQAGNIYLYVDAAPNAYGSPDYDPWKTATYEAVANGSFVNMSNGVSVSNIGTTNFEIQDEVVYSFGDLGLRLSWIYWVPGETTTSLQAKNFEISLLNYWGSDPVYDFYEGYYGSTWLTPGSWINYEGGVIGIAGMAYWGAYGVNTPEALAADIAEWEKVSEQWVFTARMDGDSNSITSNRSAVPEPGLLVLFGIGLAAVCLGVWRLK